MIASPSSQRLLRSRLAAALLALGLPACAGSGGVPVASPLEPMPVARAILPDDADLAARDLAEASLASSHDGVKRALARLEKLDAAHVDETGSTTGLVPPALDLAAAAQDHESYIRSADALLERSDLDPAMRARLEQTVKDEPLRLAAARRSDARLNAFATAFNTLAEPLGRAAFNGLSAAFGLGRALLNFAVNKHIEDEISIAERQALVHEKRYLAESGNRAEMPDVAARVEEDEERLARTHRDRALRAARRAADAGQWRLVLVASERALRFVPEDPDAIRLREEATEQLLAARQDRGRAMKVVGGDARRDPTPTAAAPLAIALLEPNGDIAGEARKLLDEAPDGPLADEAAFARAIALGEANHETEMWEQLAELSEGEDDPDGPNMARHAGLLLTSPSSNPYGAYLAASAAKRNAGLRWLAFGTLANGARDRDLPRPLEWLIEVPSLLQIVTALPNRLVRYPWLDAKTFGRAPEIHARAYLARHPDGEYAPSLRDFLIHSESDAGNYVMAYELVKPGETDPETAQELTEKAARQVLDAAKKEKRRDLRVLLAQRIARDMPDTEAGREAGEFAREEVEKATPQQIRLTRNFLKENPEVTGTDGLGIQPILLDGDPRNGELHPEGVVLAGGRLLELRFVAESGKESDPPALMRKQISAERLARSVARIQEVSIRNELLDPEYDQKPDARRDLFFERARFGLADKADKRPGAESSFVFEGIRDRYGLVRGRESILPVDIVLQGSLPTLGLGAFPRVRMAKPTPDAILYK